MPAKDPIPSVAEVQAKRLEALLAVCLDAGFGTLWQVREDVWIRMLPRYDSRSTRGWHPGVSLRTTPPRSLHEIVPMLHGTSGDEGPVVARGLTCELGPNYPTSFGRLVFPAKITVRDMTTTDKNSPVERPNGEWYLPRPVSQNVWKLRLDPSELKQLSGWAKSRNLL